MVYHPKSGLWGTVIGMNYTHPDFHPDWEPGWAYTIRLSPLCCSEEEFFTLSGQETLPEKQLEVKR